ncbi:MAG: DUF5658 family protein [Planctomycetota bacterium]
MPSQVETLQTDLPPSQLGQDDRSQTDRRTEPTPMFSRYTLWGGRRRSTGRREVDRYPGFVDEHGAWLFMVVLAIVALNFLDAWFTILFLSYGGSELNPMVDWLLGKGTWPFILAKSLGIGLCVAVLTVTKNFRVARIGLGIVLTGYSLLLGWHLILLYRLG